MTICITLYDQGPALCFELLDEIIITMMKNSYGGWKQYENWFGAFCHQIRFFQKNIVMMTMINSTGKRKSILIHSAFNWNKNKDLFRFVLKSQPVRKVHTYYLFCRIIYQCMMMIYDSIISTFSFVNVLLKFGRVSNPM